MLSWYPVLLVIALVLPLFDVVYPKTGSCPPLKLQAVNSCIVFVVSMLFIHIIVYHNNKLTHQVPLLAKHP